MNFCPLWNRSSLGFTPLPHLSAATLLLAIGLVGFPNLAAPSAAVASSLQSCLNKAGLPRVARVVAEDGRVVFALVEATHEGRPTSLAYLAESDLGLAEVFDRADRGVAADAERFTITPDELPERLCAPLPLSQEDLDSERIVIVAAGLNYDEHAAEAGGGGTFLFPKPSAPVAAYQPLAVAADVLLLDYEVELGFVLLRDVALNKLPSQENLLAHTAFFVANDITNREPIILRKGLTSMGTGFVEAKGQPGFFPAGPWMVRGSHLFEAAKQCGGSGVTLSLEVDEGEGFGRRQYESSELMSRPPLQLLQLLTEQVTEAGLRSEMSVRWATEAGQAGPERFYPLALPGAQGPTLTAGSVVLTGTPAGVALQAPTSIPGLVARGLMNFRGPKTQFRDEQLAAVVAGQRGAFLKDGDVVRSSIDGLGSQVFTVHRSVDGDHHQASVTADPCRIN